MISKLSSLTPLVVAQLSNQYFEASTANAEAIILAFPETSTLAVTKVLRHETVTPEISPVEIAQALHAAGFAPPSDDPAFFELGFKPEFHLRDGLLDIGDEPSAGPFWNSPDIFCTKLRVPNPVQAFADQEKYYGIKPFKGGTAFFYVRVRNIGTMAGAPRIHLFWTEQSSFVSPQIWAPMGMLESPVPIPPGEIGYVGPLPWTLPNSAIIPNISIVAVAENEMDPQMIPSSFMSYADFCNWITGTNNVTMKSINQLLVQNPVRATPALPGTHYEPQVIVIPKFYMRASPGLLDRFSLAVTTDLPAGTRITALLDGTKAATLITGGAAFVLYSSLKFRPDQKMEVSVQVAVPWGTPTKTYSLHLRQTAERYTVGGVTNFIEIRQLGESGHSV